MNEQDKVSFAFDRRIEKEKKRIMRMINNSFCGNYKLDSKYMKEEPLKEQKELYKVFDIDKD